MTGRSTRIRPAILIGLLLSLSQAGCAQAEPSAGSGRSPSPSRLTNPSPAISTDWVEYHRDAGRGAQGPAVPALSSPAVAWRSQVDGEVYASLLVVAGHVVVATENNTVYALDVFTGAAIWKTHLGAPVEASTLPCGDIGPVTGITGTPAADLASGRLYVVAFLQSRHHMLFALNLVDGSVVSQQDVDPVGSTPAVEQQRGALAVGQGYVYIPLGGLFGDCGPYHGYVVAIPRSGGAGIAYQVPSSTGAGIWSPAGVTLDQAGNVYAVTGNGASRGAFDYSNTVVELSPDLRAVQSYFAPANWVALNAGDTDLGALGLSLVAGGAVAVGKDGEAYLLRPGHLGGIGGQTASLHLCAGAFGGTAVGGTTVFVPCADGLYALSVGAATLTEAWRQPRVPLGSPILAAGALWAIEPSSATLYALDPATGAVLFSAGLGSAHHFTTPAATDGFVVAPAGHEVVGVVTAG